jgi:hypothetical protein
MKGPFMRACLKTIDFFMVSPVEANAGEPL